MTNSLEPSSAFGSPDPGARVWRWRFEDSSGAEVTPDDAGEGAGGFPSQSDAESWIGEVWRDLLEGGVDQVTLFEADRQVYGPMSLHAAG